MSSEFESYRVINFPSGPLYSICENGVHWHHTAGFSGVFCTRFSLTLKASKTGREREGKPRGRRKLWRPQSSAGNRKTQKKTIPLDDIVPKTTPSTRYKLLKSHCWTTRFLIIGSSAAGALNFTAYVVHVRCSKSTLRLPLTSFVYYSLWSKALLYGAIRGNVPQNTDDVTMYYFDILIFQSK